MAEIDKSKENYGKELVLDLHGCDPKKMSRYYINKFTKTLCKEIDMQAAKMCFWDYKGYPEEYEKAPIHLKGTSAIQFITTSNITIHTLDKMNRVYLNIFSCKDFDSEVAAKFSLDFFGGKVINQVTIDRI